MIGLTAAQFQISLQKGPDAKERQAKSLGINSRETKSWRIEGGQKMRTTTTTRRHTTGAPQTRVVPFKPAPAISEKEVAEKFSALVIPYSSGDLAQGSDRTKECAKHWKAASRAPNSSSLITLARRLKVVRDWLVSEIDLGEGASAEGAEAMGAVMTGLQLAANLPGQEGVIARTLLSKLQQGDG